MRDSQIYALLINVLRDGFAAQSINNVTIQQSYQPTQQGVPVYPLIVLHTVSTIRKTTQGHNDVWDEDAQIIRHYEHCFLETRFQLDTLTQTRPSDPNGLTASDFAQKSAFILQSQAAIKTLTNAGVNVLYIFDMSTSYVVDDRQQHLQTARFDFSISHLETVESTSPVITSVESRIESV